MRASRDGHAWGGRVRTSNSQELITFVRFTCDLYTSQERESNGI